MNCRYRHRDGRFPFGRHRCAMALPGKKWTATDALCNTCDGPKLENVHDCVYFKIGTDKGEKAVITKGYCLRVWREAKDLKNEIADLSTCGATDAKYYKRRPTSDVTKCKYKYKPGWLRFGKHCFGENRLGKYHCAMALPGKRWTATQAACSICDGPMLESVHDCAYFKFGTEKPYPDRNTITAKGYCFRVYKETKDFKNEIKDLSTCGPKHRSPEGATWYRRRPEPQRPPVEDRPVVPAGLKIWTLLPALPVAGLGIYGLTEEIRRWSGWSEIGVWIAISILAIALSIGLLGRLLLRGRKWAFLLYKLLITITGLGWGSLFYGIMKSESWTFPREFTGVFLVGSTLAGAIVSMVVLFSKLPKIKALLYPEKVKAEPKRIFLWAKSHLMKGDIIIFSLIVFVIVGAILSSKNNKTEIQSPPPLAPAPEAPAPAPAPAPEPKLAPKQKRLRNSKIPPITKEKESVNKTLKKHIELGKELHEAGRFDEAITEFNIVRKYDPNNEEALQGIRDANRAIEIIDGTK